MTLLIRERSGDSLTGDINGANTSFLVSLDYDPAEVYVYRNGLLLDASKDNGFTTAPPRGVVMKEAPLAGDTLEVEYRTAPGVKTGGGAEGGCPDAPQLLVLAPRSYADGEDIPAVRLEDIAPAASSQELRPGVLSDDLKPVIVPVKEGEGGC